LFDLSYASQYDVDIKPVVKVANQRFPKALLAQVWKQLCEEATAPLKQGLDAAVFDWS
jgi:eukaryotic translation initiation factor 2C